jgi:hypothetical protein
MHHTFMWGRVERASVWRARWGGRGEPCTEESGGRGSRHKAVVEEDEAGVEVVAEETGVEWWRGLRVLG